MTQPFIFVSTYKLKEGQLEDWKEWTRKLVEYVESREPRMIAFNLYVNEEGTEVTGIQVHPDAASMESHMQIVREYIQAAYGDYLEAPNVMLACGEGRGSPKHDPTTDSAGISANRYAPSRRRLHTLVC